MNASLWTATGQALVCLIAGAGSVWARRSSAKTEDGNHTLADLGRKMDRVEGKIDAHIAAHASASFRWEDDGK